VPSKGVNHAELATSLLAQD